MPEYAKMKNADLEALLKTRGLPTGGKKAEMVERLTKDDEDKKKPEVAAKPVVSHPEDEIDWDEDEDVAPVPAQPAKAPSPAPATTAAEAGGEGPADNPQAVPNQVADIDPSKTNDLSVKEPSTEKPEEKKEPPPDFTRGLAASNLDEEIEKRKKRAAKFGLDVDKDEGLKKLERAKKFGETGVPKGLDEALPERTRKRGREGNDQGGRGRKERRGDRFGGRRGQGPRERRDAGGRDSRPDDKSRSNNGPGWMSEADRLKAEERKKKWAAPAASS